MTEQDENPFVPIVIKTNNDDLIVTSPGTISSMKLTPHRNEHGSMTVPNTTLFLTWIQQTKEMQEKFFGHKFEDFTHEELVEWIRINVLAAEDELHEALAEISWKPWASAEFFNREAYLGEIVDVLHFVGNLVAGAGITDAELNAAYLEKMERNRQRQTKGYTGTEKCTGCKRAVDDIVAHGGFIAEEHTAADMRWCDVCVKSD